MKLSTRNQLAGTVSEVTAGEAMAVVKVALEGGDIITSSITREAAEDLGLETGKKIVVLIKSTDVGIGVED
jgi:molybdopterin-binding protein